MNVKRNITFKIKINDFAIKLIQITLKCPGIFFLI